MSASPLVSCIMPTRNRRGFVSQAIGYFLRQDYPNKELVVVDDGEDSIQNLIPPDDRIRYRRIDTRLSLGAKRNLACELSGGDLIAHWDDDDWMSTDRLSVQVAHLLACQADACGLRNVFHYRPHAGDAWLYCYPEDESAWLAGGTLLYRRAVWGEHPFSDINVGEDTAFVAQLPPDRIRPLTETHIYVALIHPGNTAAKNVAGQRWRPQPLYEISRLLASDRAFYVGLRNGRYVPPTDVRTHSLGPVTVCAQFDVASGYGSMAEYLVLGMARAGANVRLAPISLDVTGTTEEFRRILQHSRGHVDGPVLYFSWPKADLSQFASNENLFINTMWESSRLPDGWARHLNHARAVIVPTKFVGRVCRDSGVIVPIEIIPEGVDPEIYHLEDRPPRAGLTTLMVAPVDDRKHVLKGVAAWKKVFGNDPEARLIIKTSYNYRNYTPDDVRISYIDRAEKTRGIAHWYRQADVLLALGNEGFGLPLVEGMATGLPVIALNSEGQNDTCEAAAPYLLPVQPVDWQPYTSSFGPGGVRGVPGVDEVAERLQWVAGHRDEARAMGRAASAWVSDNRNIWEKGPAVLDVMERTNCPPRTLRTARTIWVPTWGSPCGVAEHVAHLVKELPSLRVTSSRPDVHGLRLLQVEHGHALFRDADLAAQLQRIRAAHVPIVLSEHAVLPYTSPVEGEADVLVAATRHGVGQLSARWRDKRVEHIPLGCPTWFPPRKPIRGRVIGAFGFLEKYKGFWHLLDVLRHEPGTSLVLFSHAKSRDRQQEWTRAAAGLPVSSIGEFLPSREVVTRLAAAADILVFWYDETSYASASAAIRVGLSTGVPVLASPTSWFRELTEVTYQPTDLRTGIRRLLDDRALRENLTGAAREYCEANSWACIAKRYNTLWQSLEQS